MLSIPFLSNSRRVAFCAAAIAFSTAALAHDSPRPTEVAAVSSDSRSFDEAAKVVDGFHAALAEGNPDAALSLLTDNIQIYEQGWVERSKAEYAAHHLASDIEFTAAVSGVQTARSGIVIGDMAYVATEARMTGRFKNKNIDSISLETAVLHRTANDWRIAHIHWSSRNAK